MFNVTYCTSGSRHAVTGIMSGSRRVDTSAVSWLFLFVTRDVPDRVVCRVREDKYLMEIVP